MAIESKTFSKLVYTTPREFDRLITHRRAIEIGADRIYDTAHIRRSKSPAYSLYSNTCSIFKVNETCGHIDPENKRLNLRDFVNKLTDIIRREQDESDKVSGFVLGGKQNTPASEGLAYEIGNTFDKEGVDFSMIVLKNENSPKGLDSMLHKGDTIYFTQEYNPQLEKDITTEVKANPNPTQDNLERIFSKYWNYLEISPNHTLGTNL